MRDNLMIVISGRKRIGKTNTTLKELLYYAYKSDHPKRVLIIDVNGEFGSYRIDGKIEHKIPLIRSSREDIIRFSNGKGGAIARIAPTNTDGSPMTADQIEDMALRAITYFRNGILYAEDFSSVFSDSLPKRVASLLCNNAHRGCDLALTMHSIDRLLPKIWTNVNRVRFHKQNDEVSDSRDKIGKGRLELFAIAEKMVNKQYDAGNIRFYVWINIDDSKLEGDFSPRMLSEGITEYLSETPRAIDAMMRKRDEKGGRVYDNYEDVLKAKTLELFRKYWGNGKL